MDTMIMIYIGLGILLLLLGILLIMRIYHVRTKSKDNIPEDVLNDFNRAEQLLKESKGKMTPQQILFQIYKEHNSVEVEPESIVPEPTVQIHEVKTSNAHGKSKLSKLFKRRY